MGVHLCAVGSVFDGVSISIALMAGIGNSEACIGLRLHLDLWRLGDLGMGMGRDGWDLVTLDDAFA